MGRNHGNQPSYYPGFVALVMVYFLPWQFTINCLFGKLGGGFKYFFNFILTWGKPSNLTNMFQMGWNHQLDHYQLLSWKMYVLFFPINLNYSKLWILSSLPLKVMPCLSLQTPKLRRCHFDPPKHISQKTPNLRLITHKKGSDWIRESYPKWQKSIQY